MVWTQKAQMHQQVFLRKRAQKDENNLSEVKQVYCEGRLEFVHLHFSITCLGVRIREVCQMNQRIQNLLEPPLPYPIVPTYAILEVY